MPLRSPTGANHEQWPPDSRFAKFYQSLDISYYFTSVGHPRANGEAEVTNRTLLQELKTRLDRAKGSWTDEIYNMLWAYRTI